MVYVLYQYGGVCIRGAARMGMLCGGFVCSASCVLTLLLFLAHCSLYTADTIPSLVSVFQERVAMAWVLRCGGVMVVLVLVVLVLVSRLTLVLVLVMMLLEEFDVFPFPSLRLLLLMMPRTLDFRRRYD